MRANDALAQSNLPLREAQILLSEVLGKDAAWLLVHGDEDISADEKERFSVLCARRRDGEPIAYILGRREFYGRSFTVDRNVLIPRPATEGLIDAAGAFLRSPSDAVVEIDEGIVAWSRVLRPLTPDVIVDVGTGSGCIAVTLAALYPRKYLIATDVSAPALNVARSNAATHGMADHISFVHGANLDPIVDLSEPFLLVSNPPYVPLCYALAGDTLKEPRGALVAGVDGADIVRSLTEQAQHHPFCSGWVMECRADQVTP